MNMRWLLASLLLVTAFAGCVDNDTNNDSGDSSDGSDPNALYGGAIDDSHRGHLDAIPQSFLPDTVTGMEHLNNPITETAYQIWANDDLLYVASGPGLRILDISDPTAPVVVAEDIEGTGSRDVDLMFHPNGRLYAVLAAGPTKLFDVTDPNEPFFVSESSLCTHNIAVVPGTAVVYNSKSVCHATEPVDEVTAQQAPTAPDDFEIIDFTDPENPVSIDWSFPPSVVTEGGTPRAITAVSCHHTTFQMDRNLAYCAGVTQTLIWDIEDPLNPTIVQVIDWPGINIHHAVYPAHGGDMLILGDEMAGVIAPTPTCSENVDYPTSALWFFDVSDMSLPTPLGYFQADHYEAVNEDVAAGLPFSAGSLYCSTHFGGLLEDRDLFVISWYTAGTILVDFSDPTAPVQVDEWKGEGIITTTDALYYKGHVYSADTIRGVDVLQVI